jgi:hypothetical protein
VPIENKKYLIQIKYIKKKYCPENNVYLSKDELA